MKLSYLPVRAAVLNVTQCFVFISSHPGRCDPILMLLVDSGIKFEEELITLEDWTRIKKQGRNQPPEFPFSALPLLTFGHGPRGGQDTVLSETGAILTYLEGKLAPPGSIIKAPDALARLEMIREASSFLLNRLLYLSSSPDWLSPPHRSHLLKSLIKPYLISLSHHLSSSFFPPLLADPLAQGVPGTSLSGAAATSVTAINFIQDLFPHTLGRGEGGGMEREYPKCEALRVAVESRGRIKAWREEGGEEMRWSGREFGSREFIGEMADKWDKFTSETGLGEEDGEDDTELEQNAEDETGE